MSPEMLPKSFGTFEKRAPGAREKRIDSYHFSLASEGGKTRDPGNEVATSAFTQKKKAKERILPFVTSCHPAVSNLKQILMEQWSFIENQPSLKTIYLKPPTILYKRGKYLKDTLVRSKI